MPRRFRFLISIVLAIILLLLSGFHTGVAGYEVVTSAIQQLPPTTNVDKWFTDLIAFGAGMLILCCLGLGLLIGMLVFLGELGDD